ncbi:FecR family protein [Phocaeicola plebeius]|uniref:FecR family protein n=1 Tax=Phocaeicola plebeius TaxID=310297 RepID=UPI00294225A9|nr:FecR domain-containing protein [Phocaeicola plebeius]
MTHHTFDDIEKLVLDDEFFVWAQHNDDIQQEDSELFKKRYSCSDEEIKLAVCFIRSIRRTEDSLLSMQQVEDSYARMLRRLPDRKRYTVFKFARWIGYAACIVLFVLSGVGVYSWMKGHEEGMSLEAVCETCVDVPHGQRKRLLLPDGSLLWVNAGSSVRYVSTDRFKENRIVWISGEAFLDVFKDIRHPFTIKTDRMEIKVLGTRLDVRDYQKDGQASVVLESGRVSVTSQNQYRLLVPSQRLISDRNGVKVDSVDVYDYVCWKDAIMSFHGEPLSHVLEKLSGYYGTEILLSGMRRDEAYYGKLDLNLSLDDLLRSISCTIPMEITRKDHQIVITLVK